MDDRASSTAIGNGATQARKTTQSSLSPPRTIKESNTISVSNDEDADDLEPAPSAIYTFLDLLRPLVLLPILLPLLSYLTTSPTSYTFNVPLPNSQMLLARLRGPLHLTDAQLSLYNGTDPNLPILLGLAGEIYDVSASPHIYGPEGSYHFFAGRDGSRGFVTGCWDVEKGEVTGDLRGLEEMFLPTDDDNVESNTSNTEVETRPKAEEETKEARRERKLRRERERRLAKKQVTETIEGWRKMFDGGKGGKYFWRGTIQRGEGSGWEGWGPEKELCEKARKGRPRRTADQV